MGDKPLVWVGSVLRDLRAFPIDARRDAGYQLRLVQSGLSPSDWKPMPSVGPGVVEIRIHTALEHRVLYLARHPEAVYVLHAFQKRSRKTATVDVDLARKRLSEIQRIRSRRKEP
jgi:phage-related protein